MGKSVESERESVVVTTTTECLVLRCKECGLPFAQIQGGALIIQSVHSGQKHVNVISIAELFKLVTGDAQKR